MSETLKPEEKKWETDKKKLVVQDGPNQGNLTNDDGFAETIAPVDYRTSQAFREAPDRESVVEDAIGKEMARRVLSNAGYGTEVPLTDEKVMEIKNQAGEAIIKEHKKQVGARKARDKKAIKEKIIASISEQEMQAKEREKSVDEQLYGKGILGKIRKAFRKY